MRSCACGLTRCRRLVPLLRMLLLLLLVALALPLDLVALPDCLFVLLRLGDAARVLLEDPVRHIFVAVCSCCGQGGPGSIGRAHISRQALMGYSLP